MTSTKVFIVLAVTLCLGCSYCHAADSGQQQQQQTTTTPAAAAKSIDDSNDQLDQETIMQMCNESFHTSMGLYSTAAHSKQTNFKFTYSTHAHTQTHTRSLQIYER